MPTAAPERRRPSAPPPTVVPFVSAAHEHTEPVADITVTPGTSAQTLSAIDVPAFGFIRHLFFEITGTGGVIGTGSLGGDYPHNLFSSIALSDVNGAPIFGPYDGYATLMANVYGGYGFNSDPRRDPAFVGTINPTFKFRVPVEISHHDGFGALANQNSAANYKLNLTVNAFSAMMATLGTATAPTFRIRVFLEAWTLPNDTDVIGRPQQQFPPVHGTSQFWSQNVRPISVGNNTTPLVRVGNLIRNVVVVARNASGVRADNVFPDPAQVNWDARVLLNDSQGYRKFITWERANNLLNNTSDTGVFVFGFDHSNKNNQGDDSPTLWLPTVQSTRLEIAGVSAAAGTLQVLTNDVAPAEVIPAERYVETSQTGFHPAMAGVNSSAQ